MKITNGTTRRTPGKSGRWASLRWPCFFGTAPGCTFGICLSATRGCCGQPVPCIGTPPRQGMRWRPADDRVGRARRLLMSGRMAIRRWKMPGSKLSLVVIALALWLPSAAHSAFAAAELGEGGAAWIVNDMVCVGPGDTTGMATSISLEAGRGEYTVFQAVVRANTGVLTNVRVTASALVGAGTISPDNIEVYRESFIVLPTSTPHRGTSKPLPPGTYPDGLIPTKNPADGTPIPSGAPLRAQNHTISAGETQPYWVDVFVPRTAPPGTYKGTVTIEAEEGTAILDVELAVWKFTLPVTPSLKSSFGMWAKTHNKQDYLEVMKHRLMPIAEASYNDSLQNLGISEVDLGFYSGAGVSNCSMSPPPSQETLEAAKNSNPAGLA